MSGLLRLAGATSGYVELAAPAVAGTSVLELPTDSIKPGLVLVAATSFSAQASVSVDDCFTSEYDNYQIISTMTASAAAEIRLRVRASGSDLTSSYWFDVISAAASSNAAYMFVGYCSGAGEECDHDLNVRLPHAAARTRVSGGAFRTDGNTEFLTGFVGNTTSYDGFTVYPQSGTITGSLQVFGYRKAL